MRQLHLLLAACTLLAGTVAPGRAQQQNLMDVGTTTQLFIDPYVVRQSSGVCFTLHPADKHPANPVLRADQPFEGRNVSVYGSVLYNAEEKLFKMWYNGSASEYFSREVAHYATSADGKTWQKPLVGTLKAMNGKPHNAVADCVLPSVTKDPRDPDPARRYKMICYVYDRGYLSMVSPDGLNWKEASPKPIVPISYVDDVVNALWDSRTEQYVVFGKLSTPVQGRVRRCLYRSTSRDFRHWTKLEPAFLPDPRDDLGALARVEEVRPLLTWPDNLNVMRTEFYGTGAYAHDSCLIAFPWVFTVSANVPRYGNHEGPSEIQLAVSRDLDRWERPFRQPVIRRGKADEWDGGFFSTSSQAFRVGDEIRLYYTGTNYTHGAPTVDPKEAPLRGKKYKGALGLATWPLDRFVSVDAPAEGGSLTTVPLRFKGRRLELNARTAADGGIDVELLDVAGRVLAASEPVRGDNLRHAVTFPGTADLSGLNGRPVALRFKLRKAELFSFGFRE